MFRHKDSIMARSASITALFLSVLAAGCAPTVGKDQGLTPTHNASVYSVHQPVVQRTDYLLDLAASGGLTPLEAGRLQGWFEGLQIKYGDRIWMDEAPGYADPRTREDVAAVAASYGLLLSEGSPVTAGVVQPGMARIVVSRMAASVPTCPNWSDARSGDATSASHSNYGCATNSNLAAMIADPADLVLGQAGSTTDDAVAVSRAVKAYRDRPQTGAAGKVQSESTGGGKQ